MTATMVVLAAGMGSRFGRPKQLVPIGPAGESILDYNAHDAVAAGFDRIVVVTRPELADAVREMVGRGVARRADTRIALQVVPDGRTKPLGTTDAVLAASEFIDGPFGVANADDLYGPGSFDALVAHLRDAEPGDAAVVGFSLADTMPPQGSVSRALIAMDATGSVRSIVEVKELERTAAAWRPVEVEGFGVVTDSSLVSMNLWAFPATVLSDFRAAVDRFAAAAAGASGRGGEVLLPQVVSDLVAGGRLRLRVVRSAERWAGLTNPQDLAHVREHAAAGWSSPLWAAGRFSRDRGPETGSPSLENPRFRG